MNKETIEFVLSTICIIVVGVCFNSVVSCTIEDSKISADTELEKSKIMIDGGYVRKEVCNSKRVEWILENDTL